MTDFVINSENDLTEYNGTGEHVVIPDGVITIAEYAFNGITTIKSVVLPESLESIEEGAFFGCEGLTKISIPKNVVFIEEYAFANCVNVASVEVDPENAAFYSEGNCIIDKETKELVWGCSASVIPEDVTRIGEGAFLGCVHLTEIIIPNGVTSIGRGAFPNCDNLKSVFIPASVEDIGTGAFDNMDTVDVDENNPKYYSKGNCIVDRTTKELILGSNTSVIPEEVTSINEAAFAYCNTIESVDIPKDVMYIERNAFNGCEKLKRITVPSGVTNVGSNAFSFCDDELTIQYYKV